MAIYHEDIADINLNGGSLHRSFKTVSIGSGDQNANRFGMRVHRDGEPVDLTGVTCQAVFQDPMENNIALTNHGTVSGNIAYVTLPQACYNYEGRFCLAIKLIGGGVTGTMRIVDGVVNNTHTGGAVAPTGAVPTYQEVLAAYDDAIAAVEEVNILREDLDTLLDGITEEETTDWTEAGTTNYPNGWAKGYYHGDTGETVTSNVYIRTNSTHYFVNEEATLMELFAPEGYQVSAFEYKPDGTYVGKHGSITDPAIGSHTFFAFEKGNKFRFAMGKFDNEADSISHYSDASFLSECKAIFYTVNAELDVEELSKQVANISTNLDAIFYTEDVPLTADDLRTGYYDANTGSFVTSNRYISTASGVVISKSNATRMTAIAPDGYFISAYEYTPGGVFVKKHGSPKATKELDIPFTEGNYFRLTVGRFSTENPASDNLTDAFAAQIKVSIDEIKLPQIDTKKDRTGDYEFFTVTVDRPLAFGGEEVIDETEEQEIECVLRLPTTYTKQEKPTRLVLACHGASGYIQASSNKWYNSNWKAFMDELLTAGYAVFDANVLPASTGTDQMGFAVGSPYYINVLKKAYDYIIYNYNVYPEIFAHGTSMGGVGATAFAHAYPDIVLAESSFAGRNILRYLYYISIDDLDKATEFAAAWGYESFADLMTDKFSHIDGCFPDLSIINYVSGVMQTPPDREADFTGWLEYFGQIANLAATADPGIWTGKRAVPYKAWNSWADSAQYTKLIEVLAKVYNRGNACQFYSVTYESGSHTEMSYGQINDMRDQLIAWYKRWE